MTTQTLIWDAHYRLARHYLDKLRQAEKFAALNPRNRLALIHQVMRDWAQIKRWQVWSASWSAAEREKADLCIGFALATSSLLRVRILPSESLVWMKQGLQAASHFKNEKAELSLLYFVCLMYANMESYGELAPYLERLLERAYRAEDDLSLGRAWLISARKHEFEGAFDTAEPLFLKSLELMQRLHANEELASIWQGLGRIALQRGDYPLALEHHLNVLDHVTKSGHEGMTAAAHLSLSGLYIIALRDYPKAETHAQQAVAIGRRINFVHFVPAALIALAHAKKWLNKLDESCAYYAEALTQRDLIAPSSVINALYGWGQANYKQNDLEQAFTHLQEALEVATEKQILFRRCEVLLGVVVVDAARKEIGSACQHMRELINCARQLGTPPFIVKVFSAAVILWQVLGDLRQAGLWAGVLTAYLDHIDEIWFDTTVFKVLEADAMEEGKALSLDVAFELLLQQLEIVS